MCTDTILCIAVLLPLLTNALPWFSCSTWHSIVCWWDTDASHISRPPFRVGWWWRFVCPWTVCVHPNVEGKCLHLVGSCPWPWLDVRGWCWASSSAERFTWNIYSATFPSVADVNMSKDIKYNLFMFYSPPPFIIPLYGFFVLPLHGPVTCRRRAAQLLHCTCPRNIINY